MYNKYVGSPPKTIAEVVRIPFELTITKEDHPFLLGFQSFYGCDGSLVGSRFQRQREDMTSITRLCHRQYY